MRRTQRQYHPRQQPMCCGGRTIAGLRQRSLGGARVPVKALESASAGAYVELHHHGRRSATDARFMLESGASIHRECGRDT